MEFLDEELGKVQIDKEKLKKALKTAGLITAGGAAAVLAPQLLPVVGSGVAKGVQEIFKEKKVPEKVSNILKVAKETKSSQTPTEAKTSTPTVTETKAVTPPQDTTDNKFLVIFGVVLLAILLLVRKKK